MWNFILRIGRRLYRIPALVIFMLTQRSKVLKAQKGITGDELAVAKQMAVQIQDWASGLLKILGIELHVHGDLSDIAKNGGLLISNHQSYLDILVHAAAVGMRFTPNSGIRSWPFFGNYVAMSKPIWIDRSSPAKAKQTLDEFRKTVAGGIPLMIYPEGTTTRGDVPLLKFKSTAFETVCGTDRSVQPILTYYKVSPGDKCPSWYDDTPFICHVWGVIANKHTTVHIYVLPPIQTDPAADRKELAQQAHDYLQREHERLLAQQKEA